MLVPGPRDDWFIDPDVLIRTNWLVTNRSDRVGMRLVGMPLEYRWPDRQLPARVPRAQFQVPPNGFPVILGPDHPVTGGYPVIGVVTDDDIDKVAQVRPGQTVRLHWSRPRRPTLAVHRTATSAPGRTTVCTPRFTLPAWSTPPISTTRPARMHARMVIEAFGGEFTDRRLGAFARRNARPDLLPRGADRARRGGQRRPELYRDTAGAAATSRVWRSARTGAGRDSPER